MENQPRKKQEPAKIKASEKKGTIMFKQMRKYDLHVGRNMITFRGREEKKIPASWLKHEDFLHVKNLFIIRGE